MATIALEAVAKTFPGHPAVRRVDLAIADGEFMVLVGPSGCGKSTLLRLIAGLDTPDEGIIRIGGRDVTETPPQHRDLAMVFQNYALYPHMTVRENLAYGLKTRRMDAEAIVQRVSAAAESLGLQGLLDRRPAQLSGGQRQRVALGRAIVRRPQAFLLDEPLSNLDPSLRLQARTELRRLHRSLDATVVYVTHDQEEAMTLGDRVAVMRDGRIEQAAPPMEVYSRPANLFVAGFIGAPAMNFLPPALVAHAPGSAATAAIRPQDVLVGEGSLRAVVDLVEPRGHDAVLHLRLADDTSAPIVALARGEAPEAGSEVAVSFPKERVHLFDTEGRRIETGATTG